MEKDKKQSEKQSHRFYAYLQLKNSCSQTNTYNYSRPLETQINTDQELWAKTMPQRFGRCRN